SLNGADRVIIDGRQNASGTTSYITFSNTQAAANGNATIKFSNDAQNDIVRYCTVNGNNSVTASTSGIITFGNAASGGSGNSGDAIDHCNITQQTTDGGTIGIYSD